MPYSESRKNLKPILWFFTLWFLIEIASFWLITAELTVRARHAMGNLNSVVILQVVSFSLRTLFAHFFVGLVCYGLFWLFKLRRAPASWSLFILSVYIFTYNIVQNPQIFDEFTALNTWAPLIIRWSGTAGVYALAAIFLATLAWGAISQLDASKRGINIMQFAMFSLLAYFFFVIQGFDNTGRQKNLSALSGGNAKKNIILLSVDSLRGDALDDIHFHGPTADFLKSSVRFERVITPQANSHASLYSLLTSKDPIQHGVRFNLSMRGLNTDDVLSNSPIESLKNAGYSTHIIMDSAEYHYFEEGRLVDKVHSPEPGFKSVLLPLFFRSRVMFGLLNNSVGFWILPELRANTVFSFAYKQKYFTERVIYELQRLEAAGRPFFVLIHSCGLHWPGDLTYPYYPEGGFPQNLNAPQFAYSTRYGPFKDSIYASEEWPERSRFNSDIYRMGVRMMRDEFLDPVFSALKGLNLVDNSFVALLSDHGENLWAARELPLIRFPEHGSSLLFGADSEQSFLALRAPSIAPGKITGTIGIVDVMKTALSLSGIQSPPSDVAGRDLTPTLLRLNAQNTEIAAPLKAYSTETSIWPRPLFSGQLLFTPIARLPSLMQFSQKGLMFYDHRVEGGAITQKQRAVYLGSRRTTVYPTRYGYRMFTCDKSSDPDCRVNAHSTQLDASATEDLYNIFAKDVAAGYFTPGLGPLKVTDQSFVSFRQQNLKEMDTRGWAAFMWAMNSAYVLHDFKRAGRILEDIAQSNLSPPPLRAEARNSLFQLCSLGAFSHDTQPHLIREIRRSAKLIESLKNSKYFLDLWKCATHVSRADLLEVMSDFLETNSSPTTALLNSQLVRKKSSSELELISLSIEKESRVDFQVNAARLFSEGDDPPRELMELLKIHQRRPVRPSQKMSIELKLNPDKEPSNQLARLDLYFEQAKAYQLTEELAPYYDQKFSILNKVGLHSLLPEIFEQMSSQQLPLNYNYKLLNWIDDQIAGQGPGGRPLAHIRRIPFESASWEYDGDFDQMERLHAKRALLRLCRKHNVSCKNGKSG